MRPAQAPFSNLPEKLTSTAPINYKLSRFQSNLSYPIICLRIYACSLVHFCFFYGGILELF